MSRVMRNKIAFQCPKCDTIYVASALAKYAEERREDGDIHVVNTCCPTCYPRSPDRGLRAPMKFQPSWVKRDRWIRGYESHVEKETRSDDYADGGRDGWSGEEWVYSDGTGERLDYDKMSDDLSYEAQCDRHALGMLDMDEWY